MVYILTLLISSVVLILFMSYVVSSNSTTLNSLIYKDYIKTYYSSVSGIEESISRIRADLDYKDSFVVDLDGTTTLVDIRQVSSVTGGGGSVTERTLEITSSSVYSDSQRKTVALVTITDVGSVDILEWNILE